MTDSRVAERAGENLRAYQDRALAGGALKDDFSSLVAGAKATRVVRRRRRQTAGAVAVLACALLAVGIGAFRSKDPLSEGAAVAATSSGYSVDGGERVVASGGLVGAAKASKTIEFDGARMKLSPHSEMRVSALRNKGAEVELLSGDVDCSVTPNQSGSWTVRAGDYHVRVVGTVFKVRFEQESGAFETSVTRGVVEVSGPAHFETRILRAGESLVVPGKEAPDDEAGTVEATAEEGRIEKTSEGGEPVVNEKPLASPAQWRKLAQAGRYPEAMAAVEKRGFDATVARLGVGDLIRLADVARMAGQAERASSLLHRVRSTAPGSGHAATAAYSLGTTAFDQQGDFSAAARWFSTYLRETPGGPLAREALGRMMEAQSRAGMTTAAADTAKKYLARHPAGPHKNLAAKLARAESR